MKILSKTNGAIRTSGLAALVALGTVLSPSVSQAAVTDLDGDGVPNSSDPDIDNDGKSNGKDSNVDGGIAKSGPFAGSYIGDSLLNDDPTELDIDDDGLDDDSLVESDIDGDGLDDDSEDEKDIDCDRKKTIPPLSWISMVTDWMTIQQTRMTLTAMV